MKNKDKKVVVLGYDFYFLLDIYKIMRYYLCETEVNNIAIKLEQINFDKDTKE